MNLEKMIHELLEERFAGDIKDILKHILQVYSLLVRTDLSFKNQR